jgi:hypothetical protein
VEIVFPAGVVLYFMSLPRFSSVFWDLRAPGPATIGWTGNSPRRLCTTARTYSPAALPPDLQGPLGPIEPVLARLDPLLQTPVTLSAGEFSDLVDFVKNGLLDPRILPHHVRKVIPRRVPSGSRTLTFQFGSSELEGGSEITVADEESTVPTTPQLRQNYPNPFNPSTTITFAISQVSFTTLKVYNLLGQEVVTLVNEEMMPGVHEVTWSGAGNASGVYLYRLQMGAFTETRQMILLR